MNSKIKILLIFHIYLIIYSFMGMASKYAAQETFLSKRFFLFYFVVMINMIIYAIVWQQVIKKIPLTTAYANKSICIIWMALLGTVFFNEVINIKKIIGMIIVIIGVILVVMQKEND